MESVSNGKFSYEPVFYGATGWIPIDTPEISTQSRTAPWGPEEPKCWQKTPLDICVAEHAIKCAEATGASCSGDNPQRACVIAGAPVDSGASTASALGYTVSPGTWFNSFYTGGDWSNSLLDVSQDPTALSACEYVPGGTMTYDGARGTDSDPDAGSCVARAKSTCESFETTAGRYNRNEDDDDTDDSEFSNPDGLADPQATCEALGPCIYKQAEFPSFSTYKALPGVTESQCIGDPDHGTNRFGHKDCYFHFYWRNVFSECYDGALYGFRPLCYSCVIQAPEVPGCLTYLLRGIHVQSQSFNLFSGLFRHRYCPE